MITIRVFDGKTGKEIKLTKEETDWLELSFYLRKWLNINNIATNYLIDSTEIWIIHTSVKEFTLLIDADIFDTKCGKEEIKI